MASPPCMGLKQGESLGANRAARTIMPIHIACFTGPNYSGNFQVQLRRNGRCWLRRSSFAAVSAPCTGGLLLLSAVMVFVCFNSGAQCRDNERLVQLLQRGISILI